MPVHDWTRVDDGAFHTFHQDFITALVRRLNGGLLPSGLYAATERSYRGWKDDKSGAPDVLALSRTGGGWPGSAAGGRLATAPLPVRHHDRAEEDEYAARADRAAVRATDGDELVAVFELVSAGNKSSRQRLRQFASKAGRLLRRGVHLLVVDLHPPTRRDPHGIHPIIWAEIIDRPYQPPPGKPFTLAAYSAGSPCEAFVEPVGLGDVLPDMPLYLTPREYIRVPLEAHYMDCWGVYPQPWKERVEPPADA